MKIITHIESSYKLRFEDLPVGAAFQFEEAAVDGSGMAIEDELGIKLSSTSYLYYSFDGAPMVCTGQEDLRQELVVGYPLAQIHLLGGTDELALYFALRRGTEEG